MKKFLELKSLAESLDFRTPEQYFEDCILSFNNGKHDECKKLFDDLNEEGKLALLSHINGIEKPVYQYYADLL